MAKAKKTFVRFDSNGNMIPGTMINAVKMPTDGYWIEIKDNKKCCNPYTELTYDLETTTPNWIYASVRIYCTEDTNHRIAHENVDNTTLATIAELTDYYNSACGWMGDFVYSGTVITLKLKQEIADYLGCTGGFTLVLFDNN